MTHDHAVTAGAIAAALGAVREARPRVHCITNTVAQTFSANTLLALGAVPSMTLSADEIGDFVARADGLLVNLGTFDALRADAVDAAMPVARERVLAWCLDPAHAESSPRRIALARKLIDLGPAVLRCNAEEFRTLFEAEPGADTVARAAMRHGIVVALTGARDILSDGWRTVFLDNGHPLQARVTAAGCAASAVVAAFLAVIGDPLIATAAGLSAVGVAAEIAGETAAGPASLQVGFLDALYGLDAATLEACLKLSPADVPAGH